MPQEDDLIAVWFSCGVASAVAAKKTIERYGSTSRIRIVNTPVVEEHSDNQRFLKDIETWLNQPIEFATCKEFPDGSAKSVWKYYKFMSSPQGASCTLRLKKHARQEWEIQNKPNWHVLGFTADERKRAERFRLGERSNLLTPLIDENLSKQDCMNIVLQAGIEPPKIYSLGFPNANCIGCVKATSPTYWNLVRKEFPEVFRDRAEQSRQLGIKLTRANNRRIFLDELDPEKRGQSLKAMNVECGIFCEERV